MLVVRLALAAVLVVAGVAKAADPAGSRRALADFGVPAPLVGIGAVVLPLAEILIGLGLVWGPTAWLASVAALALLAAFTLGIGYQMARGRSPECHCFGQLSSSRAGPTTLLRNLVMGAAAAVAVAAGASSVAPGPIEWLAEAPAWAQLAAAAALAAALVIARLTSLVIQLTRQHGRLLLRIDALEAALGDRSDAAVVAPPTADRRPGAEAIIPRERAVAAPPFTLPRTDGIDVSLAALLAAGRPILLVFVDPGCGACGQVVPHVLRWQQAGELTIALVSRGTVDENRAKFEIGRGMEILLQEDREVARAYSATATPTAVLVDQDGLIRARAGGSDAIGRLGDAAPAAIATDRARGSATRLPRPTVLAIGDLIPSLGLAGLAGGSTDLGTVRDAIVLFWDPTCGFCQRMIPALEALASEPATARTSLVVVASGSPAANAERPLPWPVLLDPDRRAFQLFGAQGTPMAVRVDAASRVASGVVAGEPAVLALAGARKDSVPATAT